MDTRALIIICTAFLSVVIVAAVWIAAAVSVSSLRDSLIYQFELNRAYAECDDILDIEEWVSCLAAEIN